MAHLLNKQKTVDNCKRSLNRLARVNKVSLIWMRGHTGIPENEIAYQLVGKGTMMAFRAAEPTCGIAKDAANQE